MNRLFLLILGLLTLKVWRLSVELDATNRATADAFAQNNTVLTNNIISCGNNYEEITALWEDLDVLGLDFYRHLNDYGHIDMEAGIAKIVNGYVEPQVDPELLEIQMRAGGVGFQTSRPKGLD